MFKKIHQYNSRTYDVSLAKDAREYEFILDTLATFDFAIEKSMVISNGTNKKNIHVDLNDKTLETWLIRMGFTEA